MTEDKLAALRRMVKDRTNIEESRNALLQLLKRNAIEPEAVMEFVEAYQEQKKLKQPVELPAQLRVFIGVNYDTLRRSIEGGWTYAPMIRFNDMQMGNMDDEIFEVVLPLKGRKQITGRPVNG